MKSSEVSGKDNNKNNDEDKYEDEEAAGGGGASWYGLAVEADCFMCFTALMGELRDVYVEDLDDSLTGIKGRMAAVRERKCSSGSIENF
jgi:hypothetical protein